MSRILNDGGRECASQVLDLHFKICSLGPKSAFFSPKTDLEPSENGQLKGEMVATLHMQLDFPMQKGPLGPSNSTVCPRTAPKRPPKGTAFVHIDRRRPQTKNTPYLGLRGSKRDFERT